MYQTYWVEVAICVYRHLPTFLSSFSYVPDLLRWVDYLCLSSFTDLFVKFFVCTRLTVLSWLFVFIVIYRPFCQVFRMYQTYWVELTICVYRHLPTFLSSFSYVPDLLRWVDYLCLSSFTDLFVKFFVCTRLTALSWLFVFIVIYRPFCQVFRMYQTYCVELAICVYRHLPIFLSNFSYVPDLLRWVGYLCLSSFIDLLSSFSYLPDLLCWVDYLCLSSFTDLFVKFFVCTRLTALSWLFVFIVIYQPFCQVFRMYQTYCVELTICVYRHLPTFLSSFSYVPDLLCWVGYLCLSSFTDLFVKFFVCTRLTVLSWLFVFIVIYQPFCQVFRMYQTYCVELAICVYRHLPIFLSSFSYVPDLLGWVDYLCLSSYTDLFVKFFVCTRLTVLSWLFVFIVIYRSFCQVFRMYQTYWVELTICVYRHLPTFLSSFSYVPDLLGWGGYLCLSSFTDLFVKFFVCTRLTALSWLFVFIVIYRSFCQVFRMYQTYCVELTICVYRHLPTFLSSFSYVPDLLGWVGYLCLSSFTDLFVKFFICTRLTGLNCLFVFIVIYRSFCQVFRMYQTYWVELTICVYRHLPTFLSSFSYVPDLLGWVGYLCLSSFTDLFVKFFVCTRLTALSWLFGFIVIYQPFCQVFRMYQTYCVELTICVYRHLPTFLSSFSYVPDLLCWVGYLCLSSFTDLFVKFFVCTRLTVLSWLFVFIVIYRSFCQVFRMYQTYCVELAICVYRNLPIFLSSFSYVPDLLGWGGYLCLSSFTDLFVKFFVCTRLTALSWLFVFIVIYRSFCQVFRMYQTYWVELAICVYRHLPIFLSSFSYVPDILGWIAYLCLSSFTDLFVKFFVCTRLTGLSWLFVFIVIYRPFCQVFRMYQTYWVELAICVYRHLPIFLSSFSYVPDLLRWVDYLGLSLFTNLFVKFFVCTRLTVLSWLFVFIVIYRPFCQVFRMYQTYCVELAICVYRHLQIFLSSFSYVPDLLCLVDYLCLSSFTDLFVKFFVCTRLTVLSWLFVFIVIYRSFCQVFRMYQTYWVEVTICVYRHLPIFLSSFSYVPDLLRWVDYLCLSSFTDLFVKFFVCTRLTALSWLFVFIVIYRSFVKFFVCTRLTVLSWLFVFIVIHRSFCQVFRMYQTYCVALAICVYRHLPIFLSSFSYVPHLLGWVDYLCLSSFTNLFVKCFVCTRLTVLSWLFVFIVIYQPFCQVFRMYQTYCVELTIWVYRYLPTFLSSFSYVPDLLRWVDYLCLSSFTDLFVKFFVCTRLTGLSWLFVFIVIYRPFCQVFRMYQTYCVELAICVYRHLPTFLSSFSYVPDLLGWVDYLCLSSFTDLFVKFFVCTRLTALSWLFVFIVIYQPFCQVFRMYQTYCVELTICVYRHLPTFLSSFSYLPDLLCWVGYLCLSSFTDLFVKFFVCTRHTGLSWLFVFIVIYQPFCQVFVCTRLTGLSWLFVFIVIYQPFCQVFRMYQTHWVELTICVYRHLPTFMSSFSYVPDLLGWVGYLCLSSFTDLFVKFFICTRLTGLNCLFVFIVIYRSFCQVFRMYQTYWVELTICVYRHLPTFLSSFSYVPDLLGWVGYLCLSSFTDLFVKFFVCTRLTALSWLFGFIVIYQPFCQVFRMYQTYCVELTICVYRHLPTFLSSFSYVPDLLCWVGYLCLSSFTDLFVKFFVCTRLTVLSWLFVFIVIYRSFCQVFRMYQTYCVELAICVYRNLPIFLSSFSYVPDLLGWGGYLCLSSFTDLFVKFFVCTRLTALSWLFVLIVIYRSFCQVFRMYQTYWVELAICVYRHLPIFLSSFSYVPDLLGWIAYLCLSSFTDLFVKFFVCTRLTGLSWLFVFIVIYRPFCQVFRMYQTYWVELAICVYRHLPIFLSSFSYVPDLLRWVDYLGLSLFTNLFVKFFVCTRLTVLSWLFVFIVIYRPFCQVFRMYQTYCVELAICVYRHLQIFLSSFSYVPDLLCLVDYLCLSSFTDLFVKFFVCTRLTVLSWLFVFIVIYRSFCQVFRMYQTYWVEVTICVYRHLPIFLSSFSYVPDLLRWVDYLCLSSFTDLFVKFFVCTRLTALSWLFVLSSFTDLLSSFLYVPDLLCWVDYLCLSSFTDLFVKFFVCTRLTALRWLFVFIVIYRSFCQVFRMYHTYWVELTICVYRHLPTFLSSVSYVPDLLCWVGYLCLSSFTNLFVKFFVCTRLTALSWLFGFIVIYQPFCQVFRMYQTYCVELTICVYHHLPIFLSSFSYVPDLLGWVDYLCLSSFTDLFVKCFVCTRLTVLSWLFVFIVIYQPFCQVFRMYQTYWVELIICVYRHLPIFLSSFSYVPDLLRWVDYLCLSLFTNLFVKFFVCTRLTVLSWLFVFIVIYRPFCQVFRIYQTYCVELAICVYRHLPIFLSSFSYVPDILGWVDYLCLSSFTNLFVKFLYAPDLLGWVGYLCLSSFTNLFVKFFVCTRLTGLSWLFVFIVIYQPLCQVFRMYQTYWVEVAICVYRHLVLIYRYLFVKFFVCTRLTVLSWLFVFIVIYRSFCQVFRMYQTYCVELAICVYRHLPIFLSSFSYVPDLLGWVGYLCLSSFTDLFVKFFVCTRLTVLSWLFVFIVIYRSFCQVFRMYQTYCVELAICVYRNLPIFLSSFLYVPDLLCWVGYLCLSSFTDLFVKFFVCTRLTVLSWLFVFIVIYRSFCQVFRMYQTYCVELAICVYRHLPIFLSSFSYVPDLLGWVDYLCLSSFTDLFVKFFVCTRLTALSWLFVFIVIYRSFCQVFRMYQTYCIYQPFCQVFRMYQTYCVELAICVYRHLPTFCQVFHMYQTWVELPICVYRHLPIFLSSFSYVPDLLGWVGYLCLSSFTDLFVKFFVCTRLTVLSWLFVFIVIYRSFCQVFRMYQTYCVELTIWVYRYLPIFLSSFSYVPDLLCWVGYLCLSSFTDLFVKFFVCTRLTVLSWLFVFIVIYRSFCQVFRMYQTYCVELASSFTVCQVFGYLCLSSFTDFCQVFRMYQTYCVELAICVYRHLPIFLSSFSYVPDLLYFDLFVPDLLWLFVFIVIYLCLSSFTDLFVKFFVCTRLTVLSWLFVFIVIYRSFCQVLYVPDLLGWVDYLCLSSFTDLFVMYQTYWVELAICVYRHLPIFLSSFSYVPDLLRWVDYLGLSLFTNLFVKFFVCTRLTVLSWLFVFIVIYRPFCQVFRMYQTYCVELAICVYRHLPIFLSSFSYVPDLLCWVDYLCLSSFTDLFVKFFVCTRLTVLSWLFVFIVIYRSFCQVFRMYQTYWVEVAICVYRHLPIFLSSFSYVPDLLRWVDYLCLSSFTDLFVKFFVCTRLTGLSWLFVFIVIYRSFCQVFHMYQTYWVELPICVYRHLPIFLSSFSYVPDLLGWVDYLCLSSFTDLFVKFFVCTRLTGLSWLFVFIVIYRSFCQVFRMYQTYCVELTIWVYRYLPTFLSSFSYVPDLLCWVDYLCLSSFTDLFVKFFVCTRLTVLSWLFVFIVIYRSFCQVFRMYQTYCV